MLLIESIGALRDHLGGARPAAQESGGPIVGLVPTMGYLHPGHQQLVSRAARECDEVVVTIFVNPLQFAAGEDLDNYPRDPEGDARKAADSGATVLFAPSLAEMYPRGATSVATTVSVAGLGAHMEGASRPTHFAGVCTVVAKLFNIVGPCRAYFGEKDYQQLASISMMAEDLSFPVEVVGCPTARAPDGLALSSRNAYLSAEERAVAPVLYAALGLGARLVAGGEDDAEAVRVAMAQLIDEAPLGEVDYVEVADAETLEPLTVCNASARLFGAVRFGRARLIDTLAVGAVAAGQITQGGISEHEPAVGDENATQDPENRAD